jgi:hypothetical protein
MPQILKTNPSFMRKFFSLSPIKKKVIGTIDGITTYPDSGTGNISSVGIVDFPINTSTGILKNVLKVKIEFFPDLTRKVFFLGCK